MDVCKSANDTIIFIIFCIILFTLILSAIILLLNIVNYILFTVYCINDSVSDYTSENPDAIILEQKYKYRLLNYVKNSYDNRKNIDANASDLYIRKTILYYNYIVKMVLLIIFVILMGVLYNVFRIGVAVISQCDENGCNLIVSEILQNDTYIYYIIIIACIYAYVHSYIYTYFFNKNIYKELYGIYNDKYKKIDTVVSYSINYVNDKETDTTQGISSFIRDLKDLSYDTLEPLVKAGGSDSDASDASLLTIVNEGIENNNKFVIPTEYNANEAGDADEANLNNLFKKIYKTPLSNLNDSNARELFAHKITIYLIYNYVISNAIEDPFIIHKMNNIYLNLFENLFEGKKDDPNYFLEQRYDKDTADMFKQIRGAYTIKLLLPATTTKEQLTSKMNENALYIEKYIREYMKKPILTEQAKTKNSIRNNKSIEGIERNQRNADADKKAKTAIENIEKDNAERISDLMTKIKANIDTFADGFFDYYQEDKTAGDINRVVYKINLYLAIEMMETIIYIVLVLLILYNSGKYPYLEDYINMAITYAIVIINELISAILGII